MIMLIEQTTTYAYKLKYLENPTFDKVKNLAKKFIDELPKELVDDLYNSINRGVDILKTEPEMLVYLYSFGNMHQAKLNFAFDKIPEGFFSQSEINVIDYGCGQAIGTMCYADFLKSKNYNQQIKSVTLIEPSKKCLRRAALHTSIFFPDAEITTVNKTFDELVDEDINCDEDVPTLHILSNVLDLEFNISKFTKLVKDRLKGYNQFVCVGPYFGYEKKDFRMEDFAELVGGDISFSKAFGKSQFVEGKNWTCQTVVASVGELEEYWSTEVTEEDIKNGVEDDFCGVYSKDGKRLLRYRNTYGAEYKIALNTIVICDECFLDIYNEIDYMYIRELYIPKSVKYIGNNAFCGSIEKIVCDSPYFVVDDGFLLTSDKKKVVFYFGKEKNNLTLGANITILGSGSFCSSNLSSVLLPSSLLEIEENPFVDASICEIRSESPRFFIDGNILFDDIEKQVISYFGKDKVIEIPNGIKTIGAKSFFAALIKKIIIPNTIEYIDETAFDLCWKLEQIIIPADKVDKFKFILSNTLWDNLYCLKKAIEDKPMREDVDLPF